MDEATYKTTISHTDFTNMIQLLIKSSGKKGLKDEYSTTSPSKENYKLKRVFA